MSGSAHLRWAGGAGNKIQVTPQVYRVLGWGQELLCNTKSGSNIIRAFLLPPAERSCSPPPTCCVLSVSFPPTEVAPPLGKERVPIWKFQQFRKRLSAGAYPVRPLDGGITQWTGARPGPASQPQLCAGSQDLWEPHSVQDGTFCSRPSRLTVANWCEDKECFNHWCPFLINDLKGQAEKMYWLEAKR